MVSLESLGLRNMNEEVEEDTDISVFRQLNSEHNLKCWDLIFQKIHVENWLFTKHG